MRQMPSVEVTHSFQPPSLSEAVYTLKDLIETQTFMTQKMVPSPPPREKSQLSLSFQVEPNKMRSLLSGSLPQVDQKSTLLAS